MSIARFIDHTLLRPDASDADIRKLCREAAEFGFAAVCVSGSRLRLAGELLSGSRVRLAAVAGFPHGNTSTGAKCYEAEACVKDGADEVDVVLNIGWIKDGNTASVASELKQLREAVPDTTLKLILETCYLEEAEKRKACILASEAGWDFVKTSTGFGTGGATLSDVALMRESAGAGVQIKASGGIRDYQTAMAYLQAGASRLGTSSGPAIVLGEKQKTS